MVSDAVHIAPNCFAQRTVRVVELTPDDDASGQRLEFDVELEDGCTDVEVEG